MVSYDLGEGVASPYVQDDIQVRQTEIAVEQNDIFAGSC